VQSTSVASLPLRRTSRHTFTSKKGKLNIGRFEISYRVIGEASEHILCVNGVQQTMGGWLPLFDQFMPQFSFVLYDLPGHGKSSICSGPLRVDLNEQVNIIEKLLAHLNIEKTGVIASSWGGIIAAAYSSRSTLVNKLCLLSFTSKANTQLLDTIDKGIELADKKRKREIAELFVQSFGTQLPLGQTRKMYNQFERLSDQETDNLGAHGAFIRSVTHFSDHIDYSAISSNVLIAVGGQDNIIDFEDTTKVSKKIAHCELKIYPERGHFMHFEDTSLIPDYHDFFLS